MSQANETEENLQCELLGLSYDFVLRHGDLRIVENECCDMTACIKLFEAIDSGVRLINTYAGDDLDTVYRLTAQGWAASGRP